ncbi:MAG: helix-turn-helix transcriptional regulator [Lewinellaceae bacterium]|nr:helix-turn-helix transcriptional regulator [Lewinellaceae bacterium]
MIIEHKKIEKNKKVVFETIVSDSRDTFNFRLKDEACFVHVKHGTHVAISPSEVMELPEGNLAFSVGENLILKAYPNIDNGIYQTTIIHIDRETTLKTLAHNFPDISSSKESAYSFDTITGKPCVITQNYIEGILHYFNNPHIITNEIIALKVKEILFLLLRSKKAKQVTSLLEGFVNRDTKSFKNTVENHLFNDISLNELAHLCNMSLSTFKRHFKKIYNATPTDYIIERRLENSRKLLATSGQSIIDIALASGFKSVSHYSRKFKGKYGIPPSQYKLTFSELVWR